MTRERRVFNFLPDYLKTNQNSKDMSITDDVMYEPEQADFLNGYIGDSSILDPTDLVRTPLIQEDTPLRQQEQLSIGTVYIDPDTQEYSGGSFYSDLVRQIQANGGITRDPNRIFGVPYYAWTPPIDYDKHINFSRYFWIGPGNAITSGEYVTKEPAGSRTVLFLVQGSNFVRMQVTLVNGLPDTGLLGELVEDASTPNRLIHMWTGDSWSTVTIVVLDDLPESTDGYVTGQYLYVCRTSPSFQRPVVWTYSNDSGRWLSQSVVVSSTEPDTPRNGMIWEDCRLAPYRQLKVYRSAGWLDLTWTAAEGPQGQPQADMARIYDLRDYESLSDGWAVNNWWKHFEDLSPSDRAILTNEDQATRPILEFWNGIESYPGDRRSARNDFPVFQMYAYLESAGQLLRVTEANFPGAGSQGKSTVYQYQIGSGTPDAILGFPLVYNSSGEFQFELTLETTPVQLTAGPLIGNRYYKDLNTGYLHGIWEKSDLPSRQVFDQNTGLYSIPVAIGSNPNHEDLTVSSRSQTLAHFTSVIKSQSGFSGSEFGLNGYRWSTKNPTAGASIIDCESTLLRSMSTLPHTLLDIPDAIRQMAKEYNKVLYRFTNKMNQLWDDNTLADPTDTLYVSASVATDVILTELMIGKGEGFPFYYSDMGTYVETQMIGGVADVLDPTPKPIIIPSSPARLGLSNSYKPEKFIDRDGSVKLRGHDGVIIDSFGDQRDDVWMELQTRFFRKIPTYFSTETEAFSSRFTKSNFYLRDYYGNYTPETRIEPVSQVVPSYLLVTPSANLRVFSIGDAAYAFYDGYKWILQTALVDDVFLNLGDNSYYIYNGVSTYKILTWNNTFSFDYSFNEYRTIIRREFERWANNFNINFIDNTDFDVNDPFTWNYTSAGVEGHYLGIYQRIYNTVRPHSHPWEIVGFYYEPTWWRTKYVPSSTSGDGTPRYSNTHAMWTDIQNGVISQNGLTRAASAMAAPIPVGATGELLDPITAGIVMIDSLDQDRIDDSWVYGDGAPAEQNFYDSPYYGFANALAAYLMKNGVMVDLLWSLQFIDIGNSGTNKLWRSPHIVHTTTLTRPRLQDIPVHLDTDSSGNVIQALGLQAWISERVNIYGGSVKNDFAKILHNTYASLGWKTSGYINSNRTVISTLGGTRIPFEDIHTTLHVSPPISENFASGVMVTREGTGYRVFGYNIYDPVFRIELPAIPIVGGQVELREEFIAAAGQHEFTTQNLTLPLYGDTTTFAVLIDGLKIKSQHITVIDKKTFQIEGIVTINGGEKVVISVLTLSSNSGTQTKKFNVNGVDFPYFSSGSGVYEDIEYGRYFDTSTDVINFMLGYGRALTTDGWVFDQFDSTTGDTMDWLNGAKQFAAWVLNVKSPWNSTAVPADQEAAFTFSPFMTEAKFKASFGTISSLESIQYGAYGIVGPDALPVDPDNTVSTRIDDTFTVTASNGAQMYGVRAFTVEYQHVVFFSNTTKFNDIIYSPILALYHKTLRVDSYRTSNWNGRLEANGFIVNGGDLLPNFEKQTFDITRYYDRINTIDDPLKRDQARNLYGWYPNDSYMDAIGADDRSRFDFYRGMIHAKGTRRPTDAFIRGTRLGPTNVSLNEQWAWKIGEYGDTRRDIVQICAIDHTFITRVQVIQFGGTVTPGSEIIGVSDFIRSTGSDSSLNDTCPWILPPPNSDEGVTNWAFPVTAAGLPDTGKARFYCKFFDKESGDTLSSLFHYDPQLNRFDPDVISQIDYNTYYDPARYTDGPGDVYSNSQAWGDEQVGKVWWASKRKKFVDYRSLLPDYDLVTREWGKLFYFKASITRDDTTVTVNTINPYTGVAAPHGLFVGDIVTISGAEQEEYNGEITITAITQTRFQYAIDSTPDSPATGNVVATIGSIEIYEWVKSPVPPSGWEDYIGGLTDPGSPTGLILNSDNPSWVQQEVTENGITQVWYYFWIKNNAGINNAKTITGIDMSARLTSPTNEGIGWFAPVTSNILFIYQDATPITYTSGIEIITDQRDLETHVEWVLFGENDAVIDVPVAITDKIIDSLSGVDQFGSTVPSELLAISEKYGNAFFPPQTIFQDVSLAMDVFINTINGIFATKNLYGLDNLTKIFNLSTEGTFWKRSTYTDSAYVNQSIYDTVATIAIRDDRASREFYKNGDLVLVKTTTNPDPWTGANVGTIYVYNNGTFSQVGITSSTITINATIALDKQNFRKVYAFILDVLETIDVNHMVLALMHEMLHQNPLCDWLIKTSYLALQVDDTLNQIAYVRPNEIDAIVNALNDTKAFRSKYRSNLVTYTVRDQHDLNVGMQEFPDKMITLLFDRLACDLTEDGGWDGYPWDAELIGWDTPLWEFSDLGRDEWYSLGVQTCNPMQLVYDFPARYDPTLYKNRLIVRLNGDVIDLPSTGINVTIMQLHDKVSIVLSGFLSAFHTLEVEQSMGFYQGDEPTLGSGLADSLFTAPKSTYEHAVARTLRPGVYNPADHMMGCPIGKNPEERVEASSMDGALICVKTDFTPAYAGWDTTPWDSTGWDMPPQDIGRRVFFMRVGNQTTVPPGLELIPTSENFVAGSTQYIIGNNNGYTVVQVLLNGVPQVEGKTFEFVIPFKHIVHFITEDDLNFVGDGLTTSYDVSRLTNGVSQVYVDGQLKVQNTDYTISGMTLRFIQPSPTISNIDSTIDFDVFSGNGARTSFNTNRPRNSLNPSNTFGFVGGVLQTVASTSIDPFTNNIVFATAPTNGAKVMLGAFGNNVGDSDAVFDITTAISNGTTSTYIIGNAASQIKTFVFVNGVYQVYGVDYDHSVSNAVKFLNIPTSGARIEIRTLKDGTYYGYDFQHIVLTASGGSTDTITGTAGLDPAKIMVFVQGAIKDGYSNLTTPDFYLTTGTTDVIHWIGTTPTAGQKISIRVMNKVTIARVTSINVSPAANADIRVVPKQVAQAGDIVTYIYNGWPVGPFGKFVVLSSPGDFDISQGIMTMNQAIPPENQYFTLNYTSSRPGTQPFASLIREQNVVDDFMTDHLLYDGTSGFETNRRVGLTVLDSTDKNYYQWNGTAWVVSDTAQNGDIIFVTRTGQILGYDGTNFTVLYEIGNTYTSPPLLNYPQFGSGFTWGTYSLGQTANASVDFPTAYQIMQNPGDYPG